MSPSATQCDSVPLSRRQCRSVGDSAPQCRSVRDCATQQGAAMLSSSWCRSVPVGWSSNDKAANCRSVAHGIAEWVTEPPSGGECRPVGARVALCGTELVRGRESRSAGRFRAQWRSAVKALLWGILGNTGSVSLGVWGIVSPSVTQWEAASLSVAQWETVPLTTTQYRSVGDSVAQHDTVPSSKTRC